MFGRLIQKVWLAEGTKCLSLLSAAIEIGALSAKHQNLFRDSRRICELVV